PDERYFVARGEYRLENRAGVPIRELHLSTFIHLKLEAVEYPGARLREAYPEWGYAIYDLDEPLLPGEQRTLRFVTRTEPARGFQNHVDGDDVYMVYPNDVVGNGTNLYSPFILPFIGYTKMVEHKKAWMRHRYGLPPLEQRLRPHDDPVGLSKAMMLSHLAWGDVDVTIGTAPDQTAVTSGRLVRQWQQDGRNYFRYRSEGMGRGTFTIYSARYTVHRDTRFRVPIEIHHHPAHGQNVALMAEHLGRALAFYEAAFGPYPFERIRLVEFVYYDGMVFSEAGTLGLPEVLVWKSDLAGDGRDNLAEWLSYLLAYAWWEDQLIAADVAGSMTIREALSGYASNLYRRSIYAGDEQRRLKQRQMRDFFRTLGKIDFHEPPLTDVYNEVPVARLKGQIVLELIEAQIGQPALLAAIRQFFEAHAGRPPPYATVLDLRDAILDHTPVALRSVIGEAFSAVVTYRLGIVDATDTALPDGNHRVRVTLEAGKRYTEGLGKQREAPLDLPLPVVVRDAAGGIVHEAAVTVPDGLATFEWIVARRPHRVAVDPAFTLPSASVQNREKTLRPVDGDPPGR
ncbi:MAG: hypothetical protein KIT73_08305, partial [Burkholderiales bacterium]|nr:hypothetical protein [Burkholderiales bacterium]